jgi:hypothetical protein
MDMISFGETLKNYKESVPSEFKGATKHFTKQERVGEGLLNEFVESIINSSWSKNDLKKLIGPKTVITLFLMLSFSLVMK